MIEPVMSKNAGRLPAQCGIMCRIVTGCALPAPLLCGKSRWFEARGGAEVIIMASYEVVREIFNACSGNRMRDVSIEQIDSDDPAAYVRATVAGETVRINQTVLRDGTILLDVESADFRQRFSFTEI